MDLTTLEIANKLQKRYTEYNEALNCFEWKPAENEPPISTNPSLIIEFDGGDGREQIHLPEILSDAFIKFMKEEIKESMKDIKERFEKL